MTPWSSLVAARLVGVAALACCCGGCLVVPIPHRETAVAESRRKFTAEDLASFRDGQATREQVLLRHGDPDGQWAGGRCLCYGWTTTDLALLWVVAGMYNAALGVIDVNERQFLLLEFDERGVLARHELRGLAGHRDAEAFVAELEATWPTPVAGGDP